VKIIKQGLLTALLLLVPISAFACYPAKISLQSRVDKATTIYVGMVTEILAPEGKIDTTGVVASITHLPQAYALRIAVSEVVKGESDSANIEAKILNCGSGTAQLNDKVIVFNSNGHWYTKVFNKVMYQRLLELNK
jgi:hypothetical protein